METPKAQQNNQDSTEMPMLGVVIANVLNVRAGAGTSYRVIDQLKCNTQVSIYEKKVVAETTWYRIGPKHWVHSGWIRSIFGIVTTDVLNIRSKPGINRDNPPIDRLFYDTKITIIGEKTFAGATWYKIDNDKWVHCGWVRILPTEQPTENPCITYF